MLNIAESHVWRSLKGLARRTVRRLAPAADTPDPEAYQHWIAHVEQIRLPLPDPMRRPLVTIVMALTDKDGDAVESVIRSVERQSYPHWELCIASVVPVAPLAKSDARLHWKTGDREAALATSLGEYVALLAPDCELAPDALLHVIDAVSNNPDGGVFYSDEDTIADNGRRANPFFKPQWSPDLLLAEDYISGFIVVRRTLLEQIGECRDSSDYDLVLRLTERCEKIVHIARVLYHRRDHPRPVGDETAKRALERHLSRTHVAATVEPGIRPGTWRVRYAIPEGLRVGIIIPSGGSVSALRSNLETLVELTTYPHYEIVVVDNSTHDRVAKFLKQWTAHGRTARYVDWRRRPFNYSAINNEGARHSDSPVLLFLNDDTRVIDPGWLTAMLELAARPEVGAAGAKLLYPDGRIQHAGVNMGIFDQCGHAFRGLNAAAPHYFNFPDVIRNVSAVTGACLMTRAGVFRQAGGFDEQKFPIAYNDVDLCLRLGQRGYRILYTPHAVLYHHEAYSKSLKDLVPHPAEAAELRRNWKAAIESDPFYHPNLTRSAEDYSLRLR